MGPARAALHEGNYNGKVQFESESVVLSLNLHGESDHTMARLVLGAPVNLQADVNGDALLCRLNGETAKGDKLALEGNCWGQQFSGMLTLARPDGGQRRGKFELQFGDESIAKARLPTSTRATEGTHSANPSPSTASTVSKAAPVAPVKWRASSSKSKAPIAFGAAHQRHHRL